MAITVTSLFSGTSKTAGTSLQITGSNTVAVDDYVFVGYTADTGGSAHQCIDNLGNTYAIVEEINNSGNVRAILFASRVTIAGTITSNTVSWTTNVTAKCAMSCKASGVGERKELSGGATGAASPAILPAKNVPTGGLIISVVGLESEGGITGTNFGLGVPTISQSVVAVSINTTGGGGASNISLALLRAINGLSPARPNEDHDAQITMGGVDWAMAGAIYYPATSPAGSAPSENADVTDDAGIGTVAWTNPSNARLANDVYATAVLTAGQTSHYLKALDYRFVIPAGQSILGIEVLVECKQALVLTQSLSVRLVKGGAVSGDTKTVEIPQTEAILTFGGSTDLWGLTLSDTDVEDATFGAVCWVAAALADTYSLDDIFMNVYFGTPTANPGMFLPLGILQLHRRQP